jgi:hypothetical protein
MQHDYTKESGIVRPGPECNLPEPVRDHDKLIQTAVCSHGTQFLLVDRYVDSDFTKIGVEWIEAEAWWEDCRQNEESIARDYDYDGYYDDPFYYRENFQ